MEVVLFIGIPASGKSSFYRERFAATHVRIVELLELPHGDDYAAMIESYLKIETKE